MASGSHFLFLRGRLDIFERAEFNKIVRERQQVRVLVDQVATLSRGDEISIRPMSLPPRLAMASANTVGASLGARPRNGFDPTDGVSLAPARHLRSVRTPKKQDRMPLWYRFRVASAQYRSHGICRRSGMSRATRHQVLPRRRLASAEQAFRDCGYRGGSPLSHVSLAAPLCQHPAVLSRGGA